MTTNDGKIGKATLRLYDGPPITYRVRVNGWIVNRRTHMKCGHPWPRICTCMWNEPPRKIVVTND